MRLFAAYPDRVLVHDGDGLRTVFEGDVQCIDAGPPGVFCGTSDGVYRRDGGEWTLAADIGDVTALAVDATGVWAGTAPSAVYRSDDGEQFEERPGLTDLPSESSWAFPPRPSTHHVRWLEPTRERLYVAVEAGALLCTEDGGATWQDRVPSGPRDTHSMTTHDDRPDLAYSAAGDGFYVSEDGGDSWRTEEAGLDRTYCWSVVCDPGDPERLLLSAAHGPRSAHHADSADSATFRRVDGEWKRCEALSSREGLPGPKGLLAPVFATRDDPGEAYAATNHGLYHTDDWGASFERLGGEWPTALEPERSTGLVVQ